MSDENLIDNNKIIDSINEFYKLKNKYEIEINKEKRKIIKNNDLSWKEKRAEFKKYKPKCINCKRPVGTIFSVKYNSDNEFRELKAICGSINEPCNLNITINPGVTFNIMDHIKELEKDNNEYKNYIIDDKNKLLFGYISSENAIQNFEKIKDAINDINILLNINYETLFNVIDNKNIEETIQKIQTEVFILINTIKQSVKDFNETNDLQFIRDSVDVYNNQLQPKLNELMKLKYRNKTVEYNEDENTYNLIQQKYTILNLEDNYVKPEIISFDFGKVTKGKKTKEIVPIPSEIQIEQNIGSVRPRIQENGNVIWDDPQYENLWNKIPIKYKEALIRDREWMQETMDNFIKNRQDKKPLKFVTPSNLILPPKILQDGTFDFGNITYNKIFNKLEKSYQNTLLTLYSEENGVKNYNSLINALSNIIGNELGFREFY